MTSSNKAQFAQFFEEVEEIVHTPSKNNGRFAPSAPGSRLSVADLEKTTSSTMTPRMEIMLKKEQKAREEAANLTFTPHVNRKGLSLPGSATKSTSKDQTNRFDALYSDALKRHLETKWKESADEKDLTFQPKITERGRARGTSRSSSRVGSRASSKEREATGPPGTSEKAADRLHATPKGKLKHGVDPDKKLTFKPEITKRAMSIDRKESAKRLYVSNSLEKERAKELLREHEVKERELENCTFSPKLIQGPPKYAPKEKIDLRVRMDKFEEMKRLKIQEGQRIKEEKDLAEATFKPTLKVSKVTKRAPTPTKPFHERLNQPIERQVPAEVTTELAATMTFKPTLVSKRAASPNGRAKEYSSVHERLFKEGEQRKRETQLAMEAMKHEAETSFTFSPEINPTSKASASELGPVFERLATSTSKQYMQEVLMKVKTELELKDCTFHPKLSTEGHKYVPKGDKESVALPVHERLIQEAEVKRVEKERLDALRKEEAMKQHTFSPQIPEMSKSMINVRSSFTSPDGGSVSGDDIFARLNAQTTIAKSPHMREASLAKESPTRTRSSLVLSEAEHSSLYDRLSAPPRTLSFRERSGSIDPNDDRASSVNRRSQAEIDSVINRLHSSHTKAMKAEAFEDPTPLQSLLRSNSMSNGNTPGGGSPDKSLMRRGSVGSMDPIVPMSFGSGASPLRRSGSMSGASPLARRGSMSNVSGLSPTASAPSPMSRHSSIRHDATQSPISRHPSVRVAPAIIEESEEQEQQQPLPSAPPRGFVRAAPTTAPTAASAPAPAAVSVAPPAAPMVTTKASSNSNKVSSGDDFMAKIEASMNMLQMNPADIVAQARGQATSSPMPTPVPVPASVPAPVVQETVQEAVEEPREQEEGSEDEGEEEEDVRLVVGEEDL